MSLGYAPAGSATHAERVGQTVALLGRRGYALPPARLGEVCLGGPLGVAEVRWAVAANPDLVVAENLVLRRDALDRVSGIRSRADGHGIDAPRYLSMALNFIPTLLMVAPFIRGVAIAGSLASGGFKASDDIDLNLIVDDGHRHLAYVVVNFLGLVHALRYRNKPVDALTRRPLAPRLMTANLILERSQCLPLARQDADMAFELLMAEPVYGVGVFQELIESNPALLDHFPQLASHAAPHAIEEVTRRLPNALFPRALDGAARVIGQSAWRYMQWTRRRQPDALARVAYVRSTMRPYTLFDS
ncbi:MAG TPA: hypothetical protein VNA65_09025 [Candidatus Dormibacteraeota bacterium]|nr:hypothetical protein [Candidatus Dormibacteraeota bacterium]